MNNTRSFDGCIIALFVAIHIFSASDAVSSEDKKVETFLSKLTYISATLDICKDAAISDDSKKIQVTIDDYLEELYEIGFELWWDSGNEEYDLLTGSLSDISRDPDFRKTVDIEDSCSADSLERLPELIEIIRLEAKALYRN